MDIENFDKAKALLYANARLQAHLDILTDENERFMTMLHNRPHILRAIMELLGESFSAEVSELFVAGLESQIRTNRNAVDKL